MAKKKKLMSDEEEPPVELRSADGTALPPPIPPGHPYVPPGAPVCEFAKIDKTGDEWVDWEAERMQKMSYSRPGDVDLGMPVMVLAISFVAFLIYHNMPYPDWPCHWQMLQCFPHDLCMLRWHWIAPPSCEIVRNASLGI